MLKTPKLELISPAGNLDKMKTAFSFGADAVYLGIPDYSLRARINDFDMVKIRQAVSYAGKINKKVYATLNIFAHNAHFKNLAKYIRSLRLSGVNGIIVSDPGILSVLKKEWPKATIHLSTQANCLNADAALFWHKQGVRRIILGREATIKDIKIIRRKIPALELEYFVHGAMCMAYSGRCFLSKHLTDRSANLGDCIQPCRWKYEIGSSKQEIRNNNYEDNQLSFVIPASRRDPVGKDGNDRNIRTHIKPIGEKEEFELIEDRHGSHILNSEDLCLIKHLEELVEAGITSFKIEGRTKSAYYVATVIGAYRKAIDLMMDKKTANKEKNKILDFLYAELDDKLYHRGLNTGFLFGDGRLKQNLDNSHKISDWEFCGQVASSQKSLVRRRGGKVESRKYLVKVRVHNSLFIGEEVEIVMPYYDIIKMKISKMIDKETGEEVEEAHGGRGQVVIIESDVGIPEYSIIRRKLNG